MPLAVEPFTGFTGLLQLILLIAAGFLIGAFVITVIMHYRQRKKTGLPPDTMEQLIASSPENCAYKLENEYILFDHSGMIRDYKSRLAKNQAKYAALKQDYEKLLESYNALLLKSSLQELKKETARTSRIAAPQFSSEPA
jgi:hypothetical protein